MKKHLLFTSSIVLILNITSCTQKYKPAEYAIMTGSASPGQETQISLDDGAAISIPDTSLDGNVSVTIERNPEKAKNLPPLPEDVAQLSDFYNFQIEGGNLIGPVDLVIPFDKKNIPSKDGYLVAMIPTGDGWKFIPVDEYEDKAVLYTMELGDPLIGWRFTPFDPCNLNLALVVIPSDGDWNTEFRILGQVEPKDEYSIVANLPINVKVNYWINTNTNNTLTGKTDKDGHFEFVVRTQQDMALGFREGLNGIEASAVCKSSTSTSETKNWYNFQIETSTPATEATSTEPTEPPIAQPETIQQPNFPTTYVILPNVVGMPFDNAKGFLERIGYKVIWIDGKSNFEISQVYAQAPNAGSLTVPHRTTVVLYRTTEKVEQLSECAQLNLTPEEMANCGGFTYKIISCEDIVGNHCQSSFGSREYEMDYYRWASSGEKLGNNTYRVKIDHIDEAGNIIPTITQFATITFTLDGAIEVHDYTNTEPNAVNNHLEWKLVYVRLSE